MSMDFKSIQELLRFLNKSDLTEVEIQQKDFKLRVVRKPGEMYYTQMPPMQQMMQPMAQNLSQQPMNQPISQPTTETGKPVENSSGNNHHVFKSPMIGTFYRSGGPDKEAFVKVGDTISKGQVVAIVEAMKLFNEIESDVSGKIVKILVENSQPVEYDQPLFLIDINA
jgi:acetyl-CoA carboxylase biotin carboxyl carrier protein